MSETGTLNSSLRNRVTRFIHVGIEIPKYYPGCWHSHKYFEEDKLKAVDEALAFAPNNVEIVDIILKAYNEGFYTRFETIAFALAKCLKVGNGVVKEATYKAAAQICNTSEELMLFNKYTRLLKTGNGRGWCKNVQNFYLRKTAMELAKELTRVKARHGRSHKTLLRKSHLKVSENDQARDAVVKYAIFGLKRTKQIIKDLEEDTKEAIEYISKVDALRHCENPVAAAEIITANGFTVDHIPGHLICCQEVWNAIMPQFKLEDLLSNIQRIHNMGFLTSDSETTAILISILNNEEYVKKSKITPIHVYIALCNYRRKSRPLKHEKAKVAVEKESRRRTRQALDTKTGLWEWTITRRHPKEIKHWGIDKPPCQEVISALTKLMDLSWGLTPATGARYLITMDMRNHMFKGRHFCKPTGFVVPKKGKKQATPKATPTASGDSEPEKPNKKHLLAECFYNRHVTPGHIALIMALQYLRREKNVILAVFANNGINIIPLEKKFNSLEEVEHVFRNSNQGKVQLDAPIEWANKEKKKIDIFINIVDRTTRYMELDESDRGGRGPGGRYGPPPAPEKEQVDHCPVRALQRYRNKVNLPTAKLCVMSLASHRAATTDGAHEGVFDAVGIDEYTPTVIDAFTRASFK